MATADPLDRTLAVFDRAESPTTPLTASEVADGLDCTRRTAYNRLERLAERGDLETKKVGARGRVWWRPLAALADRTVASSATDDGFDGSDPRLSRLVGNVPGVVYRCHNEREWPMTFVSERCADLTGYDAETVESGRVSWGEDVVHPEDRDRVWSEIQRQLGDGDRFTVSYRVRTADGETRWVRERGRRVADGDGDSPAIEGVVTDVTDRRRAEQALARETELTDRILSASHAGIAVFSADGDLLQANDRMTDLLGEFRDGLGEEGRADGESGDDAAGYVAGQVEMFDADGDPFPAEAKPAVEVVETGEAVFDREVRVESGAETRWLSINATPLEGEDGRPERVVVTASDVTRLKEQTRRLERQREDMRRELDDVFERIDDAFCALDDDLRFTYVNERAASLFGVPAAELLGRHVWDPFERDAAIDEFLVEALETQESLSVEVYYDPFETWFEAYAYPSESGLSVYFQDVTERKEFEETLTALYDSNRELFGAGTRTEVSEVVVEAASGVLDLPGAVVYRHDAERGRLRPDAASVETEFVRRAFPEVSVGEGSITGWVFEAGDPCHYDDVLDHPHAQVDSDGTEMRSGSFVPMGDHGILVAGSESVGGFDHRTRRLMELFAANAEAAYDRVGREERLERQRERLAALGELDGVVRDINEALVRQSTREEVERAVCERLADSDSYEFAWFGAVDSHSETVELRTEAGVEGYLDGTRISVDPDDDASQGPTGRAVLTGEMQISRNVTDDPDYAAWRDHARTHGFRSSAAIPVVHAGTTYGVLNVYAARSDAFTGEEREVVGQLGEVVGHAIASIDRKRALLSDEAVELELRVPDAFDAFGVPVTDGTVSFDRTVPVGDGAFVAYGTANDRGLEVLETLAEDLPYWEEVTASSEEFDTVRFELRLSEPPVLSVVASHGGSVEEAVLADGDYRMTLAFPPSVDVRTVVERVRETYPAMEVLTRRQVSRSDADESLRRLDRVLTEELTDRQRTVLEAAYAAGFFEWPRERTAREVADSLGVADATFHQHLRLAERKLLSALFEDSAVGAG